MISSLRGNLIFRKGNEIVLDVNGVGYMVMVSKRVSEKLTDIGSEYSIITYLDVKENSLQLFGFIDEREREIYRMLLSVSGIGPKIAHSILSCLSFEEIIGIISGKDNYTRVKIPGIGVKKLEMISMSLKDKIYKIDREIDSRFEIAEESGEHARVEALNALMNLGYQRSEAEKIIREVLKQVTDTKMSTEDLIRKSLEYITK